MEFLLPSTIVKRCLNHLGFVSSDPAHIHGVENPGWKETASLGNTSLRPKFEELPLEQGHPKASAWGLWGQTDEMGALNLITREVVTLAKAEVRTGLIVSLNLPLNVPSRPMNPRRKPCEHNIIAKGHANDDEININTQSSTHWDGLRHYPYSETIQFYNGTTQDDITGDSASERIGIQNIAAHPIATRGVLLDWYSYALRNSIALSAFKNQAIPLSQLKEVAKEQGVSFQPGDVLFIRTGWLAQYYKLSPEEQDRLGGRDDRASCGVEASKESIKWHWDQSFAAVASDTVAYEAWPSPKPWGVSMHEVFLSGWGMPIGECFDLEALSATCKSLQRWTFMLTSQPLHIPGGIASPANAMAIF